MDPAAAAAIAAANAFLFSSSSSSSSSSSFSHRRPVLGKRVEAQYGTDADEAWFAGKVVAVNAEDGDKEAGKPWS
jgi:hypothetical protein